MQISWTVIGPVLDPGGLFEGCDLHKVTQLSTSIEEMDAVTLNYWLSKFVMEVDQKMCLQNYNLAYSKEKHIKSAQKNIYSAQKKI